MKVTLFLVHLVVKYFADQIPTFSVARITMSETI